MRTRSGEVVASRPRDASSARVGGVRTEQDLARALGRDYGNRRAARVLARRRNTAGLRKLAQDAARGGAIAAHQLVWELIDAYCPEKSLSLVGSAYDPDVTGFRLDRSYTWQGRGKGVKAGGATIVIGDDAVKRAASGDVDALGKGLRALLADLPDPFHDLASVVSTKAAPTNVTLPVAAQEGLAKAWAKSLPGNKSKEQGGILVEHDDEFIFRPGKISTSGSFTPNLRDRKRGEDLVAIAHTHPYSAKEGGYTNVSFSSGDLGTLIFGPEKIDLMRSGDGIFLVAVSEETEAMVRKTGRRKVEKQAEKFWDAQYKAATGSLPARARAATIATCLKFHLLYYEGTGGDLAQPAEMVTARKAGP
jgi:hypothetical protein